MEVRTRLPLRYSEILSPVCPAESLSSTAVGTNARKAVIMFGLISLSRSRSKPGEKEEKVVMS